MPYSIDRLYAAARAPLHAPTVHRWQQSLQAHRDGETSALLRAVDAAGLVALRGQAQLCQTTVFAHLDTFFEPRAERRSNQPATDLAPEAIGAWTQDVMSGLESRFVAAAGAVAGRIGATLVIVGQLAISALWLGVTLSVGLMTAVYRAAWAGMFTATPMPAGLVPLVTTPSDGSDPAGPHASRRARCAKPVPSAFGAAPLKSDARRGGMFSAGTRGMLQTSAGLPRLGEPDGWRLARPQAPWQTPVLPNALRAQPGTAAARAASAQPLLLVWPERAAQLGVEQRWLRADLRASAQAPGHRPTFAHLGLQGIGRPGPQVVALDMAHVQQLFVLAARARLDAATWALPSPTPAATRITWLEDTPLEGDYVRVPRTTPDGLPTPSEAVVEPSAAHHVVETLVGLWHRLGAEHRRLAVASPDIAAQDAKRRRRWPLAGLQRSRSEPWSQSASDAWRSERRAAGVDDAFVRVLAPTLPSVKTLTGPRLPDESLAQFLQRLRDDGRDGGAYAGGGAAFVAMVQRLHAQEEAAEALRPPAPMGSLGLHPQFIKDLPRAAFYIYPNGARTAPGEAFEINQSLAAQWNKALSANTNVHACASVLSPWLDHLLPLERGLLREDVTLEATQAGLAAACEAVQRSARPGLLITPTDQKSTEFVLWPDEADGRVHIVGLVQYGSMMVMSPDGNEDEHQTPLYPYRVHVHLSVGARADRSTPRDVIVHEGNWSTIAPW